MDVRLVDLGIAEDLLNRVRSTANDILAEAAELFKTGRSEGSEVNTLKERVNFGGCFGSRKKGTRSTLASSTGDDEQHEGLRRDLNKKY